MPKFWSYFLKFTWRVFAPAHDQTNICPRWLLNSLDQVQCVSVSVPPAESVVWKYKDYPVNTRTSHYQVPKPVFCAVHLYSATTRSSPRGGRIGPSPPWSSPTRSWRTSAPTTAQWETVMETTFSWLKSLDKVRVVKLLSVSISDDTLTHDRVMKDLTFHVRWRVKKFSNHQSILPGL